MYLIDTNVISEARKQAKANRGVIAFFETLAASSELAFLSAISVGELRRGVELVRHRGDVDQTRRLEAWLAMAIESFGQRILAFDADAAQVWGYLRFRDPAHAIDKQIAAIALVNDLTLVTRNVDDFAGWGVKLANPFQ
ncbi:MAG TPA: type II toxin-antitoxin system VapC family toxin [Roseiarcus sp.]